jgi:hypothetical protein
MAHPGRNRPAWPLALLVGYALAGACFGLVKTPLAAEEAKEIYLGREVLAHGAPACGAGEGSVAMCEWPGTVRFAPAAAAWAERWGGLRLARLVGALTGLAVVLLVARIGDAARYGQRGLLVAATFVFLGSPLQLFATVHPRVLAALLVAISMALMERGPDGAGRRGVGPGAAALAGASLALASVSTYAAVLYAAPIALVLAFRHRNRPAGATLALTFAIVLAIYGWLAVGPAWPFLRSAMVFVGPSGWSVPSGRLVHVFDWLAMPYLLATFALFHRDGRGGAAVAMALASAAFLVAAVSPKADELHTAALLSLVVLAPAAGVGVAQMSELFSSGNPSPWAPSFFTAAVLAIVWAFGVQEMRALRREEPDLSAASAFLRGRGSAPLTVLVDSDYGSPEYVYRYLLEEAKPPVRVVSIARAGEEERHEALVSARPDYVVLDQHHSDRSFAAASREYLAQGFSVAATFPLGLSSGPEMVQVLRRVAQ